MTTEPPRGTKRKPIEIKNEPDEALDAIEEQNVGEQAPGSNKEPRLSLPKRQTIDFTGQKGDIVLVTGAEKSRLRVYSLFLSHVSPILESSLKQTGVGVTAVRYSNDTIPEVIFSEDDSVAFIMLCGVLHSHKTNQRARNKDIQSLAILADKYKCTHALSYVTHYWLSVGLRQASRKLAQDCWYSMTAAYWLQLPDLFCYWSGQLVSSHRDRSFLVFGNQITDHELGLKFCREYFAPSSRVQSSLVQSPWRRRGTRTAAMVTNTST